MGHLSFYGLDKPFDIRESPAPAEEISSTSGHPSWIENAQDTNTLPTRDQVNDNPDHNFYEEAWSQDLVYFLLLAIMFDTMWMIFDLDEEGKGSTIKYFIPSMDLSILVWFPLVYLFGMMNIVMLSLLDLGGLFKSKLGTCYVRGLVLLCTFAVYEVVPYFVDFSMYPLLAIGSCCGFYVLFSTRYFLRENLGS